MKVVSFIFCVICLHLFGVKTTKYDDRNNTQRTNGKSTLELKECHDNFHAVLNKEANITHFQCQLITSIFSRGRSENAVCQAESLQAIICEDDTDCHHYDKKTHCHKAYCIELSLFGDYLNNSTKIYLDVCAASPARYGRTSVFRLVVILIIVLVVALVCVKIFQWIAPIIQIFLEERSERRQHGRSVNEHESSEEQTALTDALNKPTMIVSAQHYCDTDPPPPYANPPAYSEVIRNGLPDTNS